MAVDPRTPVLVGAASIVQRLDDPEAAAEPCVLMARAVEAAGQDAGAPGLVREADWIGVPRGYWEYTDPGRLVADAVGATRARTLFAQIGVLQTSLFAQAGAMIQEGDAEVVVVTGGEAKHRAQGFERSGRAAPLTGQDDAEPDQVLRPAADILHPVELANEFAIPVRQYAVIESALRHADKRSVGDHQRFVASFWADFNRVAGENPQAWSPEPLDADALLGGTAANRMIAFPYAKLHNSNWNVDQAAGLVFCSAARADREGIPEAQRVYLRAVSESNFMLTLLERRDLHRAMGFAEAGPRALSDAGIDVQDLDLVELYSCFPAAVAMQAREIGISMERPLTVTGGMAFAGGPLNNFVVQAAVRLATLLRGGAGRHGLLDAVSGMMTKSGASVWSREPGSEPFVPSDVSAAVEAATGRVEVVEAASGPARVAGYTVAHAGGAPEQLIALCDLPDGRRALARSRDAAWMERVQREELCGEPVNLDGEGGLQPG